MPTESVACPMCGWWRPLNYGRKATGEKRTVRFDRVDPATAILWRLENLRGAGRGNPNAVVERLDHKTLSEMDEDYRQQVRQQCLRIIEVIDQGPSTVPHIPPPQPPPPPPKKAKKAVPAKPSPPARKKKATTKVKVAKPHVPEKVAEGEEEYSPYLSPRFPISQVIKDAKYGVNLAKVAMEKRAAEVEEYLKEHPARKAPGKKAPTKPKKERPSVKRRKAEKTEMPEGLTGKDLIVFLKEKLASMMNESDKTKSVQRIEDFLNRYNIDEETAEGIYDLQAAIEDYSGIERKGMSPEEYSTEKEAAFEAIQDAIDSIEPLEE